MSNLWLKMIGTTDRPFRKGPYPYNYVSFPPGGRPQIHTGDHMILYAVGGNQRVFALVQVTSEVYICEEVDWPYRVNTTREVNLDVSQGLDVDEISTGRDLRRSVRQHSHIRLTPEEYEKAANKLRQRSAATQD